ncbi:DNA cytosine methyltransferase [Leptolyngbya sp. AN03gr2]|uniref:DNA cytosine methyltransferase n=1 Tax=unclassified Leptolyngbya TaxID=2650499 RepID=UPI003D3208E8
MNSETIADSFFVGAGGLEVAFKEACQYLGINIPIRVGINHWDRAVESFVQNHPEVEAICQDVFEFDPTIFSRSSIGLLAPSCEKFSRGRGIKDDQQIIQLGLWDAEELCMAEKRKKWEKMTPQQREKARLDADYSRLTMYQVVKLIEYNRWSLTLVENVCDVFRWSQFSNWRQTIENMGYRIQAVIWNSQFAQPLATDPLVLTRGVVPQSRNRVIFVITDLKLKVPNLKFPRAAYCTKCNRIVPGQQVFKRGFKPIEGIMPDGICDYGPQWRYLCPHCWSIVEPPTMPAYEIIDWSLPCPTVGERKDPEFRKRNKCKELKPPTRHRIGIGLKKFGTQPLLIGTDHTQDIEGKVWNTHRACPTQTTRQSLAIGVPFITEMYSNSNAREVTKPMSTITTSGGSKHFLTVPPAYIHYYYSRDNNTSQLNQPVNTATTAPRYALVQSPFLVQYNGASDVQPINHPTPTIPTHDRFAVTTPSGESFNLDNPEDLEKAIDLSGFRMFSISEIKSIQNFQADFTVLGNQKEQSRLLGQAIPVAAAREIIARALEILL